LNPTPKRGEVFWVAFDPSVGGEIQKTRPAIVLSNDDANRKLNRVLVVPLTSSAARLYAGEAFVNIAGTVSKAIASQLTTVSKLRFGDFFGRLSDEDLEKVESIVIEQLGL
jgi:mRNA interferase MazF